MRYLIRYYQPHLFPDNNNNAQVTAEQSSARKVPPGEQQDERARVGSVQAGGEGGEGPVMDASASSDAAVEGLRRQLQGVIDLHHRWLGEATDTTTSPSSTSSSSSSSLVAVVAGYLSFLQVKRIIHPPSHHTMTHSYPSLPYPPYPSICRPLSCIAADNGHRCVQLSSSFSPVVAHYHHHEGHHTCSD